jgi:acyl carrier protein
VMEDGADPEEGTFDPGRLMGYLQARLPEYMVPAQLVYLESLPLTGSGKVDRKALPEPEHESAAGYEGPQDATEATLVRLWQELLEVERIGINDNFFTIGGHSLLAIKAITAISQTMGILLPLKTFFELATVRSLAEYIRINQYQPSEELNYQKVIKL